jgi:hypothetical protein
MPRNETIVPRKDNLFDSYIRNSSSALTGSGTPPISPVPPWQRLLLSAAEYTNWLSFRDEWIVVYAKYTDKAQRTTSITKQKNTLKKEFITFTESLLTRMAGSNALTAAERITINLKERDRTLTPRQAIDVKPGVTMRAKDGMRVQVECRLESDSSRPSKHKDCDVVEYRHWFSSVTTSGENTPETLTPPASAVVVKSIGESGKAKFIIQFNETDAGKILNLEVRWKNSKENLKSGPWSNPAKVMVSW